MQHNPKVFNLSNRVLNETEIKLLSKGLKYTPTPRMNNEQLKTDIKEYTRKLRLKEYFNEDDDDSTQNLNEEQEQDLVRNKSDFNPKRGRNQTLDTVCNTLDNFQLSNVPRQTKSNLSKKEEQALKDLCDDDSIVIKEADKGGGVVVMNKAYYEVKILDMLNDPEYYKHVEENQEKKTLSKIKQFVNENLSNITTKERDYLINFDARESQFYGLPKVHKSLQIKNAVETQTGEYICCLNPEDLSFRPIVGGPNSSTQRLSHLIDILLKPYCEKVPSFIKDDVNFINQLPESVQHTAKLVSFDVVSLYSNIPTELGIKAVSYWINKHPEILQDRFTKEFILEGLHIILQNNTFAFGKNHYLQVKGTAMGTKVAPTYATLTLGYLEEKLHEQILSLWGEEEARSIKSSWKRFLDDCFILWNNSDENLKIFHQLVNNLDPNIKFTLESSDTKLPFLDVLVIKKNSKLFTDIYYKTTDTHQYLHFNSCHPHHTKTAIPYNLARRICTIVSDENTQDIRLGELKHYLTNQGYPEGLIDDGIRKAKRYNRSEY